MAKKKLAFVVQRYGLEVNGGAEVLARQMCEHLTEHYDVEVITTKAVEYTTWKNEYKNDTDVVNGITVHRFGVEHPRSSHKFARIHEKVMGNRNHTMDEENKWFDEQGPYSPALIDYIEEHADDYDYFAFMTYLYYTTVKGLPKVAKKAVLIPTAHDEPPIYLKTFEEIFRIPAGLFYLTSEEKEFVERKFGNSDIVNNGGHGGSGVELPETVDPSHLANEKGISNYVVYVGRIEEAKGCAQMFDFFIRYKKEHPSDLKLVLMGKAVMSIPNHPDIVPLGFVSEQEKYDYIAGSRMLIMPSFFESLSIVVLEAMDLEKPVLVNGRCDVLKGHCRKSNGGLYYKNYYEFEGCMEYILNHLEEVESMGRNGKKYIQDYYAWDKIINRFVDVVESIEK